jgi:hypothetical protein
MEIKCKLIKELDNGSAIVSVEMDEEAKDWLIGEGFITVLKEAIKHSKTLVPPEMLKKPMATKKVAKKKPMGNKKK